MATAEAMDRVSACALAMRARAMMLAYRGTAMAARMLMIVFLGGPVVHRGCQICGRAARVIFRDIAECHPQAAIRVWTPPGTGLTEIVRARLLGLLGTPLVELLKL